MTMRHVRQRAYKKRRLELDAHLKKKRLSKTEKVLLIVSKNLLSTDSDEVEKKTPPCKRKRGDKPYSNYGISAHGREKRKGKSMPPREVWDELFN